MQVIKYRIGKGAQRRRVTDIIDHTKTVVNITNRSAVITFTTNQPHRLMTGEKVILSNDRAYFNVDAVIKSDISFMVSLPLMDRIMVKDWFFTNENDNIVICLDNPVTGKSDYTKTFPVYCDNDILHNCHFKEDRLDYIIVPSEYYNGESLSRKYPMMYIGNTLLFDWEGSEVVGLENVDIYFSNSYLDFRLPLQTLTDDGLNLEETRSELLKKEAQSVSVIPSLDMEKQMFAPYINDGKLIKAQSIIFKMHFRDRKTEGGKLNEDWNTDDSMLWNSDANTDYSDNLLDLGFTDEDIRYQKKKLKKSFIRLLFYDSPDITSQNLLAYSTIFFDTNAMYSNYTKNMVVNGGSFALSAMTGDMIRIDSQIKVEDYYNFKASSEGFYLYLYPTALWENRATSIYMKVEFNHARYGKIIPFIMPQDENGVPIPFNSPYFPHGYLVKNGEEINPDIQKYFRDMFTEIKIEFNEELNRYLYYFPWAKANDDRKITLTLFEPRVNGFNS